jgi:hypothetical protein
VSLKKIYAALTKGYRDLHSIITQHQLIRGREEIAYHFHSAQPFISIPWIALHISSFLGARILRQLSESSDFGM